MVDQRQPLRPPQPRHLHAPHLAAASKHQLFYFDAVRGLSAQLVLVGHSLNLFLPGIMMQQLGNGMYRPAPGVFYMQNLGVLLFFVLSGFLVSRSALTKMSNPNYTFAEYFLERFARIFVPFVPAVLLVALLDRLVLQGRDNPFTTLPLDAWTTVANVTMLYNNPFLRVIADQTGLPLHATPIGTANQFWSVVIEFWIYVVFGLIVLRIVRDRRIGVFGLLGLMFSLGVVAQSLIVHTGLILAWVIGMAYAIGWPRRLFANAWTHRLAGLAGLAATPLLLLHTRWDVYDEFVTLSLSVAVMSLYAGFSRRPIADATITSALAAPPLPSRRRLAVPVHTAVKYASDYSYSLYLVHFSLLIYLQTVPVLRDHPVRAIVLAFVLANLSALAYWALVERHYPLVRRTIRRTRLWQMLSPAAPAERPHSANARSSAASSAT